MTIPGSEIPAIVEAYQSGLSYTDVARKFGRDKNSVASVIHKHAPGSVRKPGHGPGDNGKLQRPEMGLTLAALKLYYVGLCKSCGVPIVSGHRDSGQRCGFCDAAKVLGPDYFKRVA